MAFSYHFNVSAALVKVPPAPTQRTRVPLIVGTHSVFAERAAIYSSLADMVTDGFTTADPEYVMAEAMLANPSTNDDEVARWFVGRRAAAVANVWKVEVLGTVDGVMNLVDSQSGVDVVIATFTASTSTEGDIRDGLMAALIAQYTDAIVDADEFSITQTEAGVPIVLSITGAAAANLSITETTPEVGIQSDLDAIMAETIDGLTVAVQTWGIFIEAGSLAVGGIVEAATWVHLQSTSSSGRGYGIFVQSTDVELFASGVTDDPASLVRDLGYTRLCIAYRAVSTDPIHCRAAGRVIPSEPGTVNWNQRIMTGSTSTTAITYTQNGTFATKRVSYAEPFKVGSAAEVRFIGGRDGTARQMYHYAAIDAWRDDMERIISFQTANSDGIDMTLEGLEIGYGAALRSEMDRMVQVGRLAEAGTIVFVDPEDIPAAEILAGDYQTTGEITITAVLRVFAERIQVSGTFEI
jgi:hypothetical protein